MCGNDSLRNIKNTTKIEHWIFSKQPKGGALEACLSQQMVNFVAPIFFSFFSWLQVFYIPYGFVTLYQATDHN